MAIKTLLIEYDEANGNGMGQYPLRAPAVEVVRCRECEYRADRGRRHYCDAHGGGFFEVESDGFCAWGERKTDA